MQVLLRLSGFCGRNGSRAGCAAVLCALGACSQQYLPAARRRAHAADAELRQPVLHPRLALHRQVSARARLCRHDDDASIIDRAQRSVSEPPCSHFICRCDFDAAGFQLQWLYSNTLTPPSQAQREAIAEDAEAAAPAMAAARAAGSADRSWSIGAGVMSSFDQTVFVNASAPLGTGVGPTGYIYVPAGCNATAGGTAACRLHISWHGCNQGAGAIGETFVLNAGYLPWADANNLVVLFPQAATTLENPGECEQCCNKCVSLCISLSASVS